jgi:uncharacterized protein (DUF58 family)
MLTRSGWLTLLAAIAAGAAGRVFAIPELFVVGAAFGMLAVVALAWVRFTVVRVSISRSVQPTNVYAGETTKVEVTARNTGATKTPVLHMADPVAGTKGARLSLAPLRAGTTAQAAYHRPNTGESSRLARCAWKSPIRSAWRRGGRSEHRSSG